jgi:hypothetical protein
MLREAKSLVSIELKQDAFLQCLIMKEIYDMNNVHFLLGNYNYYLMPKKFPNVPAIEFKHFHRHYDLIIASGVLYHSTDPYRFLTAIMHKCDSFFVWTQYYKPTLLQNKGEEFTGKKEMIHVGPNGVEYHGYKRIYTEHVLGQGDKFIGGEDSYAYWLDKDELFSFIRASGFIVGEEDVPAEHMRELPNGPAMVFYAHRKGTKKMLR